MMGMDTALGLLAFAKGTGFVIAATIFVFGVVLRLVEIWALGRKRDLAPPKGDGAKQGLRTIVTRSWPAPGMVRHSPVTYLGGYIFHIGFFVTLLFFVPHIQLFEDAFGLSWPGLPSELVEVFAVLSIAALIAVAITRFIDPVRRMLSGPQDWLGLVVTGLPLLTGFMAIQRLGSPFEALLALHILSVELLLIVLPFTKLMHALTFLVSRYYQGYSAGRKGVAS